MAVQKTGFVTSARATIAESARLAKAHRDSLSRAANLLKPGEIAGEYSAARMLGTTLGGVLRPITSEDLKAFAKNVKAIGKKFSGGITPKDVISMSAQVDRQRANDEIRTAVPMAHKDGAMHFVTNAGPDSDVTRHHVYVEFLNYSSVVASPVKADQLVRQLYEGKVRFRCDCGRFTFWYGYIATVGQFIYGDQQVNFPKIRNPHLTGVACKHSLRVMQQLSSPIVRLRLVKMIEDGRKDTPGKVQIVAVKDARAIAEQQSKQAGWKRHTVESSQERAQRLAQQRMARNAQSAAQKKVKAATPAQIATEKRKFQANVSKMVAMGLLTEKQANAMLQKVGQ